MDSNHDKGLQRALCYHYTTGQTGSKLASRPARAKTNFLAPRGFRPILCRVEQRRLDDGTRRMTYKHTQIGWVTLAACVGIVVFFQLLPAPRAPRGVLLPVITLVSLFIVTLMGTLGVEVDATHVRIKFGVGLIRKSFRLDEIETCRPVRNRWWWGWGIRLIPGGWLYNVSGLDAVELVMKNGKIFRIGTDEPRVLSEFIQARLGKVI